MIEYLNCDTCTAIVSTEMRFCEYCGNDFRSSGTSAELLTFIGILEKKYLSLNFEDFIQFVDSSKFKEHPIVKFRLTKATLIDYMSNDGSLHSQEFCSILNTIKELKDISIDYLFNFTLFITILFPSEHIKLCLEDFENIKSFLDSYNLDPGHIIEKKLIEQLIVTNLGMQFIKDYTYFTLPQNFIDNPSFIKKRNYLASTYQSIILNINNKNQLK